MANELTKIKPVYEQLDQAVLILQKALKVDYFAALSETLTNILSQNVHVENDAPDRETVATLEKHYQKIPITQLTSAQRLELGQLLLFRRQQQDRPQANLQATPSAVGILVSLLLKVLVPSQQEQLQLVDPVVGTGSLILTVQQQLQQTFTNLELTGIDNNEDQLVFASVFARLLHVNLSLAHQDALTPWLLPHPVAMVVADLPVGYYPVDSRAQKFDLHAQSGHSYAHYLLLEQSINALAPGGWGVFVVPANLLTSRAASSLLAWLTKNAYLQISLTLPQTLFQDEAAAKALIVVQKHGANAHQAKQVLLAKAPDMSKLADSQQFSQQLQLWAQENM